MSFEQQIPEWENTGTEPSETLRKEGFKGGYKPPASVFNWFWNKVTKAIAELQGMAPADIGAASETDLTSHTGNTSNPHSVTKAQVGLGSVDNTSDANKPVSTAQATAIADAKKAGTDAQSSISSHTENTSNPHSVTKAQVGLGNVPNVATNDQTPTYSAASTLETLSSGEKLSVSMGKIMKAITDFISHNSNTSNPHSVTKSQVGLGSVDNTSDANKPVSTAQATAIADAKKAGTDAQTNLETHTGNTSNPHGVTKAQIGLGSVDNTADSAKPVSTAQATAIADAKKAGTDAQTNLDSHTENTSNPHSVTKTQVGLGNVPNVATNDQTPTYTAATSLTALTSGEKLSVALGKIAKAISDLISHVGSVKNHINIVTATATDGATYTATVDGLTALEAGVVVTILPSMTATSTTPTLNVNGLGAKQVRRKLSGGTLTRPALLYGNVLYKELPVQLMYDGTYWVATQFTKPSATDLYGYVGVGNGGTGLATLTAGAYLVGNGTDDVALKTPAEVLADIGAAPDGYGLGGNGKRLTSEDDLNNIRANGWYEWTSSSPPANIPSATGSYYMYAMRVTASGACCFQEVFDMTDSTYSGCKMQRVMYGTVIFEWEWVNPPMVVGVEYRTTERYQGKPVYVKLINFGTLPNATSKDVTFYDDTTARPISVEGQVGTAYDNLYLTIPAHYTSIWIAAVNYNYVRITTAADKSDLYARVLVKYWKTTD